MSFVNGISTNDSVASFAIDLGDRKVIDPKFSEDDKLVILCNDASESPPISTNGLANIADNTPIILQAPVHPKDASYTPLGNDGTPQGAAASSESFDTFRLPEDNSLRPVKMDVHDEVDVRGNIPMRICLLGSNRTKWHTFTLPQKKR